MFGAWRYEDVFLRSMTRREVIEKIRGELAYTLPESGKPLRYIVLTRKEAERLFDRTVALRSPARSRPARHVRLLLAELVPALVAATDGMP
jgi:hypothetical protein